METVFCQVWRSETIALKWTSALSLYGPAHTFVWLKKCAYWIAPVSVSVSPPSVVAVNVYEIISVSVVHSLRHNGARNRTFKNGASAAAATPFPPKRKLIFFLLFGFIQDTTCGTAILRLQKTCSVKKYSTPFVRVPSSCLKNAPARLCGLGFRCHKIEWGDAAWWAHAL